jgi:ribonuclease J
MDMYGVDLVIPDFEYIKENINKLEGVLVSQGHEDHQGALPYLLKEIATPIYAPKLVAAFIKDKLEDYGVKKHDIRVYDPDKDVLNIGPFTIHPFRVNHSIPDTVGFAIDTPVGRTFHVAEHKFDPNPADGCRFDEQKAKKLASEKPVLMLASDALGSGKPGTTPSDASIEPNMLKIAKTAKKAIFFTTISSNIGRIQQAVSVAGKLGRKVVFVGRSIDKKSQIAHELGYLKHSNKTVIELKEAGKYQRNQLFYVVAGSYGQAGSSLYRIATNDHDQVYAEEGDQLIFSSDPAPPYSKESIDAIVDKFMDMDVDVHYYALNEGLYVSGHGSQDDILKLFNIVKPKYFIPLGGTIRFMKGYVDLAEKWGAPRENVFDLKPGDIVEFEDGKAKKSGKINVREILVDGLGIGDVGKSILSDRRIMAEHGVAVAALKVNAQTNKVISTEIMSRGFVFERQEKQFLDQSAKLLLNHLLGQSSKSKQKDKADLKFTTINFLTKYFEKETGRRPMIIPVVVRV